MRTITIILLLFAFNSYGQSYTEKYNNLLNRHEYFNNQGRLIAYKYYDNLNNVWRYQEISESPQSSYISPVNTSLVNKSLAYKQNRLDENVKIVQESINEIIININDMTISESVRGTILFKFNKTVKSVEKYDYSDNNITRQVINYLYSEANSITKTELSKIQTEIKTQAKYTVKKDEPFKNTNYKGYKKASYYSPIMSEPSMDTSKIIAYVEYGDILIIEKINDKYYKIKYKNIVGYIFEGWIEE